MCSNPCESEVTCFSAGIGPGTLRITNFLECRALHHWAMVTDESPKILRTLTVNIINGWFAATRPARYGTVSDWSSPPYISRSSPPYNSCYIASFAFLSAMFPALLLLLQHACIIRLIIAHACTWQIKHLTVWIWMPIPTPVLEPI